MKHPFKGGNGPKRLWVTIFAFFSLHYIFVHANCASTAVPNYFLRFCFFYLLDRILISNQVYFALEIEEVKQTVALFYVSEPSWIIPHFANSAMYGNAKAKQTALNVLTSRFDFQGSSF